MKGDKPYYMRPEEESAMWKLYWQIFFNEREITTKEEYAIFHHLDWRLWHWEKFTLRDK